MKYVVSVSKKGKNVWKIYGYDFNEEDQLIFSSERINPLLIWYYKLKRYHRKHAMCSSCDRRYLVLTNWHDKNIECHYCLDEYDEYY